MTREQKRLAAVFLCLAGILGTLMAMRDRGGGVPEAGAAQTEIQTEAQAARGTEVKEQRIWTS